MFDREWRLRGPRGQDVLVRSWANFHGPWPEGARPLSAEEAARELGAWFRSRDPRTLDVLAAMYGGLNHGRPPPMGWTEADWLETVVPALGEGFLFGTLEARELKRPTFSVPGLRLPDEAPPAEEPAVAEPETAVLTLEVLDVKGQPLRDERFQLRWNDQSLEKGTTNASGRARFAEAMLGTAVLRFLPRATSNEQTANDARKK